MITRTSRFTRLLVSVVALSAFAVMLPAAADDDEQPAALKDVPQAIQKALSKLDADDVEIEMEIQDGRRVYEVEFEADDAEVEFTLTEDGRLLTVEVEEDD